MDKLSLECTAGELRICRPEATAHRWSVCSYFHLRSCTRETSLATMATRLFPLWLWFGNNFCQLPIFLSLPSYLWGHPCPRTGEALGWPYTMTIPATVARAGTLSQSPTCLTAAMMCSCGEVEHFYVTDMRLPQQLCMVTIRHFVCCVQWLRGSVQIMVTQHLLDVGFYL